MTVEHNTPKPLVIVEQITPFEGAWVYSRLWHCEMHPQSGVYYAFNCGPLSDHSQADARLIAAQGRARDKCDRELLALWDCGRAQ